MKSVLITPEGIQKNLKNIKPLDAICEYIWNGFDAFATQVEVELNRNKMGLINMITIRDNGYEIGYWESDVGYAEIFVYFGLIGLIALLIWFIGVLTVRIPSEYFFLKIYLIFIIISMICGGYWFENIVEMAIITYILVKLNSGYKADLIVLEIFRCKSRNIT